MLFLILMKDVSIRHGGDVPPNVRGRASPFACSLIIPGTKLFLPAIGSLLALRSHFRASKSKHLALPSALLLVSLLLLVAPFLLLSIKAHAEEVTFIVPGAGDPSLQRNFDPQLQIINNGQAIVFVNVDSVNHHLLVETADERQQQIFDSGELEHNQFVSYTFSEFGEYSLECKLHPHIKGEIIVTDDIATFTQSIPRHGLDVQLSRSPANPAVGQDTYFKVIFLDKNTDRNHPHIDYTLTFDDSEGNYFDGMGGHTVDGAEYGSFTFDKEDTFAPKVTVSIIRFIPIEPVTVQFDTVVTPEFPPVLMGVTMAAAIGGTIALYRRKMGRSGGRL